MRHKYPSRITNATYLRQRMPGRFFSTSGQLGELPKKS